MTVVIGTAGHIDHGKTTLLRALTGIDADRLPEERARGMTIDVGYAHLALADGSELDFVDVPGHDRLVGNMLVGAGEIDAALLVVAADDGPRAQTLEHLQLLDGLGLTCGIAVVGKADLLGRDDHAARERALDAVRALLAPTSLAGSPVLAVSASTGEGLDALRAALVELRDRVLAGRSSDRPTLPRLAIDRVFSVRGRGAVVTGTLRGGPIAPGVTLRIEPSGGEARVRGLQVHGRPVERAVDGRTALNLAGVATGELRRGQVLTADPGVVATTELLVRLCPPAALPGATPDRSSGRRPATWPPTGMPLRLHLGTEQAEAVVARGAGALLDLGSGDVLARLRLDRSVAAAIGDRFVLRRPSPATMIAGGIVLDPRPPAGASRRRSSPERLLALARASAGREPGSAAALLDLHGALPIARWRALGGVPGAGGAVIAGSLALARDVLDGVAGAAQVTVAVHHDSDPSSAGVPLGALRTAVALDLRRRALVTPPEASAAASAILDDLITTGRLARDGDRVRDPARTGGPPPELAAAMARLEALLSVPAPPPFADAVRESGCPIEGVRALEAGGRLVRLDADLAYASTTYDTLARRALAMARSAPLTPAAFRDATGTSRRYVMAILEDLDRREFLRRTPDGHVPGPRAGLLPDEGPA